ncbi:peptide chain release factor family protein [Rhodopirellula sallentina]|uniref:Class I peptide chain release factor domain protein n=1 Tax=Rhodopirellula sallentina SM41 TaxID=1263870 RepID=M5U374_9BACT|nr:peptide chain release factor-like protein [Rhodopirellula sallentina]EMI52306.1 Class I peptide chain release factor domain protein [Rhodopirellula sallentina SM41]
MSESSRSKKPASDRPSDTKPAMPAEQERLDLPTVASPHPAVWDLDELLKKCEVRTQARGGPGGQHRNRTASGVFITFRPAEITAEATEERNQHRNRDVAFRRLRYLLAVSLRTRSPLDDGKAIDAAEKAVRDRFRGSPLKLAEQNEAKPAVLALLLNDLHVGGGQPSLVAPFWKVSTSRINACLRSHRPALTLVNRIRDHHSRGPLK